MPLYIDGHVHIYPVFSLEQFFASAWDNFTRAAGAPESAEKTQYVLALTESEGFDVFAQLRERAVPLDDSYVREKTGTSLSFHRTDEPHSLIVRRGQDSMILIAGRQLISKENLELLSLGSAFSMANRALPLAQLAEKAAGEGGLVVIPWGAGKWLGERGRVVERFLQPRHDFPLFLGDSGNRPALWPREAPFSRARDLRIPMLSGSDPLPLASDVGRAGSFGTFLPRGELSLQHPAASLRQLLSSGKKTTPFGRRPGLFRFLTRQLQLKAGK